MRAQVPDSTALVPDSADVSRANPFSGFETHFLSNGLKVWFKRLPGAPNVSVSVTVPYGADLDPPGKEELAHFTEHMLFSDHDGRSEKDIKDAIEGRGGRRNGFTTPDRTWYYVTIGKEHGLFAVEWLSRIVSRHAMEPAVVERNRQPVALEINAKPREFFEHIWAALNPSWLSRPDFWSREFGMETRVTRRYDRWEHLQSITPEDLREFYGRYYVPAAMTLTIIGDLDRNQALAQAEEAFQSLERRAVAADGSSVKDPGRARATFSWGFGSNVAYTSRYKFFNPDAHDELMILFTRDLLNRRLNQRLRYGERKAVYSIRVSSTKRGSGALLQVRGSIDEDEYDFAVGVIDEEIEALRAGTQPPAEFEADRTALIERLRSANQTSEALNFWVYRNFYDPDTFTDFPDVLAFFEDVSQQEVAAFAARSLLAERQVLSITRIQPVSQGVMAAAILLLVWVTMRLVAWALTSPATMRDIQYVARFRLPLVLQLGAATVLLGAGLVLGRLTFFGLEWISLSFVATVDSHVIQSASYAAMLVFVLVGGTVYLSRFPRKLLIFPDHLRIKSLVYRSRLLKPEDVEEISLRRFHRVWLSRDLFRCFPLTLGLIRPGVYLRPAKGRSYFFRTRDSKELIEVLGAWRGEPLEAAAPKAPRKRKAKPEAKAKAQAAPESEASMPTPKSAQPTSAATSTPTPAPVDAPAEEAPDDIDYDSIGLTDEEMEELLGERRDPPADA